MSHGLNCKGLLNPNRKIYVNDALSEDEQLDDLGDLKPQDHTLSSITTALAKARVAFRFASRRVRDAQGHSAALSLLTGGASPPDCNVENELEVLHRTANAVMILEEMERKATGGHLQDFQSY